MRAARARCEAWRVGAARRPELTGYGRGPLLGGVPSVMPEFAGPFPSRDGRPCAPHRELREELGWGVHDRCRTPVSRPFEELDCAHAFLRRGLGRNSTGEKSALRQPGASM